MAARRTQHRTECLDFKRRIDEHQHIQEDHIPSPSIAQIEMLAVEGATSLESLQRLVTGRKEYLEMSQNRKQKLQRYRRVTRHSEQLLSFLRANDRSSGDSLVNGNLVLVHPFPTAESIKEEQPAQLQQDNSRTTTSAQQELETTPKTVKRTLKRPPSGTIKGPNKPKNLKSEDKRLSRPGTSNIGKGQEKLNIHMAKPTGFDSVGQQIGTRQESNKRKLLGNKEGEDKENQVMGHNLGEDSLTCLRTLNLNTDSRKCNNSNNSGNFKRLSQTRNVSGVPTNQRWSPMERRRVSFNGSWPHITKPEVERSNKAEAVGPDVDMLGSLAEARVPRQEDSIWWTIKKMWKKQEKESELRPEGLGESLSRTSSVEDDPPKGGGFNPNRMLSRTRVGRMVKRRRRDTKSPPVVSHYDNEGDYPPVLMGLQTVGQPPGKSFVIPDQPYEVEEALSMDIIHTGYDFIHNG